jgi:hypothetical protein
MTSSNGKGPYGSRFAAGYQFPRTDSVGLTRGKPVREAGPLPGPWRATVAVVPMLGGRPNVFSVEAVWSHAETGDSGSISCLLQGQAAEWSFRRLVELFQRGEPPPDAVPVPPGTSLL